MQLLLLPSPVTADIWTIYKQPLNSSQLMHRVKGLSSIFIQKIYFVLLNHCVLSKPTSFRGQKSNSTSKFICRIKLFRFLYRKIYFLNKTYIPFDMIPSW